MSDKTEMVSVPRELLERAVKAGGAGVNAIDLVDAWRAIGDIRTLLAAPAEDVHEVGDEAVGQWSDDEGLSWCDGNERSLQSAIESGWMTRTLYRRPQRPVVFPERRTMRPFQTVDRGSASYKAGWNACLDEYKRLNP